MIESLLGDVVVGVREFRVPADEAVVDALLLEVGGEGADQQVIVDEGVGERIEQ
ncbi:hypothetical protein ACFYXH_22210 [Streptomyces sp. NPDC002730]|uniref:hypothetical protein n=1 Tax=Streptomyces sp. NPDC002730 TaxID=3364662 RepID=UPI0036B5C192